MTRPDLYELGPDGCLRMVCVESADAGGEHPL